MRKSYLVSAACAGIGCIIIGIIVGIVLVSPKDKAFETAKAFQSGAVGMLAFLGAIIAASLAAAKIMSDEKAREMAAESASAVIKARAESRCRSFITVARQLPTGDVNSINFHYKYGAYHQIQLALTRAKAEPPDLWKLLRDAPVADMELVQNCIKNLELVTDDAERLVKGWELFVTEAGGPDTPSLLDFDCLCFKVICQHATIWPGVMKHIPEPARPEHFAEFLRRYPDYRHRGPVISGPAP